MNIGDIFNNIFLFPLINILIMLYVGLHSIGIPGALGFAIVFLTVFIRLLVWPSMRGQMELAKKTAELKPHVQELKKKHGDDKKAFEKARFDLYREHGINPAGGCLPALIQIPVFIGLYQAIINIFPQGGGGNLDWINSILYFPWMKLSSYPDPNFFGLSLAAKPSDFGSLGPHLLLIPAVTGLLTFVQSKMTVPKPVKPYPSDSPKEVKEKESMEDTLTQVQSQMVYFMPVMIGYFAFSFPIGLAIYWNTYTILGILQQYRVSGWGGLSDLVAKFKVVRTNN